MSTCTQKLPAEYSVFNVKANRRVYKVYVDQHERDQAYIAELERVLKELNVSIPEVIPEAKRITDQIVLNHAVEHGLMKDGSLAALAKSMEWLKEHTHSFEINVQYTNLTFWNSLPAATIPTVGSAMKSLLFGGGPTRKVHIFKELTGRILPQKMTLLMGPPGCGKSTFLKALTGHLNVGSAHLEGQILYNGDSVDSGKYLVGKITNYVDEKEIHAATITVKETLEFAWRMTSGGHHSYGTAKDTASAALLDAGDANMVKLNNVLKILGLYEAANTLVGDGMIRGVSGGQKRRVTLGEMLLPPRPIKFLDAISNGLDAATTFDIVQSLKLVTQTLGLTMVVSLLQPSPSVFYSFDDLILMSEGEIIYHGATTQVLEYFRALGFDCPDSMDLADFLQEIPTPEGKRFTMGNITSSGGTPPIGTAALVRAWKNSHMFQAMVEEMDVQVKESTGQWPAVYNEYYPGNFWFAFTHCLEREYKLTIRNTAFLKGRAGQSLLVGAIAGSLFSDLPVDDSNTMNGILFFSVLFGALSALSMLPVIYEQRTVFYKHSKALFFPTPAYVLAQTVVLYPLQIIETLAFTSIVYWSVGLTEDVDGSRFCTFMLVLFVFSLCVSQFFRLLASFIASPTLAQPLAGTTVVLMVLFSGYIIPKNNIPDGWIWFYWINPIAYALKSVTVNEFLASDYDFAVCLDATCSVTGRFGNLILDSRGNPTEQVWVWYGVAVLVALYLLFLVFNVLVLSYIKREPVPPAPTTADMPEEEDEEGEEVEAFGGQQGAGVRRKEAPLVEIPFEPVTFSFNDIWYTVKVGKKKDEELDLLKGVSGYFEPGTLTALMGSSGAGKTTLLDVLSGRKNTGTVTGGMFINGKPKDERSFRHMMGYVEQFDSLAPHDTAREAVEFSAALRLPRDTPAEVRANWVTSVLTLLELLPLENTMVGSAESGGMSFEQKKRVSIAVELAANPAILFLDEPTSGLDSRSAQVVIRCIKRVAASGRSIVCTIHQPSAVIFDAFDSLLLLRRGGQTVYFGELGEHSASLVSYFEAIPGVAPKPHNSNPATWMLEVIGAGTSTATNTTDFHAHYNQSSLCALNTTQVHALCPGDSLAGEEEEGDVMVGASDIEGGAAGRASPVPLEILSPTLAAADDSMAGQCACTPVTCVRNLLRERNDRLSQVPHRYNATYLDQFKVLMYRFLLCYWRSPSYNFVRMLVSIAIALIFSSTYSDQNYSTDVDVISRTALIYVTVLFLGVVGMMSVQPVVFAERPAFYREQFSEVYDVRLYALASTLVELPYLVLSSVVFLIPYFFIVGFDKDGTADKFFWYWLFQGLYMSVMVFLGHFLASVLPDAATANVLGGMASTCITLFGGFMIKPEDFPSFWIFMYWLDPLHYALEGLVVTQFHRDDTAVTVTGSSSGGAAGTTTASAFVKNFYEEWEYGHRGNDVLALLLFIVFLRVCTYLALEYVRHDKR